MVAFAFVQVHKKENAVSRTCWHTHHNRERVGGLRISNLQGVCIHKRIQDTSTWWFCKIWNNRFGARGFSRTSSGIFYRKKLCSVNSYSLRELVLLPTLNPTWTNENEASEVAITSYERQITFPILEDISSHNSYRPENISSVSNFQYFYNPNMDNDYKKTVLTRLWNLLSLIFKT